MLPVVGSISPPGFRKASRAYAYVSSILSCTSKKPVCGGGGDGSGGGGGG